jgi:two-component system chemotaxis response regulator CheY
MKKVVVVDDSKFAREMIKCMLQGVHEVIGEASDGDDAINVINALHPDIVTLDIVMPKRSGIDVLQKFKGETVPIKFIMCSSLGADYVIQEALNLGAHYFLRKPFDRRQLLAVMHKL